MVSLAFGLNVCFVLIQDFGPLLFPGSQQQDPRYVRAAHLEMTVADFPTSWMFEINRHFAHLHRRFQPHSEFFSLFSLYRCDLNELLTGFVM